MNGDKIFNVLSGIVVIGMITAVVSRRNSAAVVRAFGGAFSGAIRAALGGR